MTDFRWFHVNSNWFELPEPKTKFQQLLRELADAAVYTADEETEFCRKIEVMERRFRKVLSHYRGVKTK